jgi:hypothetical protein
MRTDNGYETIRARRDDRAVTDDCTELSSDRGAGGFGYANGPRNAGNPPTSRLLRLDRDVDAKNAATNVSSATITDNVRFHG